MSLIGKFFGDKEDDAKKRRGAGRQSSTRGSRRMRKTPSTRKAAGGRKVPSSSKRPRADGPAKGGEVRVADAMAEMKPAAPSRSSRKKRVSLKNKQVGALLIKAGDVTEANVKEALAIQAEKGGLLGQILVELGYCTKGEIGKVLKKQRTITTVELTNLHFDPEALELLSRDFCERNRLIPFEKAGNQLCVAMANVLDPQAKTDIKERTQMQVKMFDAPWQEIKAAIDKHLPAEEAEVAAPAAAGTKEQEEDLVIELPDEEIDVISDVEEMPSQTADKVTEPVTADQAEAPPAEKAEPAASDAAEPEPVSAEELRKARQERTKEAAPEEPAAATGAEEILEVDEIEETEEVEPVGAGEDQASSAAEAPDQAEAVEAEAADQAEAVEPVDAIEEVEEIQEAAAEPAAAESAAVPSEPEQAPEVTPAAPAISAEAAEDVAEIEDLGIEAIEETEEVAEAEAIATPAPQVEVASLPGGPLPAIPMSAGYFSEVVQWGEADAERRWLAEHLADNALPVRPAPELKAS